MSMNLEQNMQPLDNNQSSGGGGHQLNSFYSSNLFDLHSVSANDTTSDNHNNNQCKLEFINFNNVANGDGYASMESANSQSNVNGSAYSTATKRVKNSMSFNNCNRNQFNQQLFRPLIHSSQSGNDNDLMNESRNNHEVHYLQKQL